jgi:hypothetical protein
LGNGKIKKLKKTRSKRFLVQKRKQAEVSDREGLSEGSFTWVNSCRSPEEPMRSVKGVRDKDKNRFVKGRAYGKLT